MFFWKKNKQQLAQIVTVVRSIQEAQVASENWTRFAEFVNEHRKTMLAIKVDIGEQTHAINLLIKSMSCIADLLSDNMVSSDELTEVIEDVLEHNKCGSAANDVGFRPKLDQKKVQEIRDQYALGDVTMRDLATVYGVAPSTISRVISGDTWSNEENNG